MTKRWAPPSPPNAFDATSAMCVVSWLVATTEAMGGAASGGRIEGVVSTLLLIVELGSLVFFQKTLNIFR